MPDTTFNNLFGYPIIPIVAVSVAVGVVALLMLACYFVFKNRTAWLVATTGSLLLAILAVLYGVLAFSRMGLLYDGHQMLTPSQVLLSQWLGFVGINSMISASVAILGGIPGVVVEILTRRSHRLQ